MITSREANLVARAFHLQRDKLDAAIRAAVERGKYSVELPSEDIPDVVLDSLQLEPLRFAIQRKYATVEIIWE